MNGRIGLALAGGGPEGAIYEIGALRALDDSIEGLDLNDLEVYVGVSAGAFIAANLANRLTPAQMCRAIVKTEPGEHPFIPETFLQPALKEIARQGIQFPKLMIDGLREAAAHPEDPGIGDTLVRLSRALPVAVLDNEPIRAYLERIYTIKDRTDDFRELDRPLFVVATDLETGRAVRFGESDFRDVPISTAVQASTALPGLYPPVDVDGRYYVDGVLIKTLHASVALDHGVDLLFCINPIVPVDLHPGNDGVPSGVLLDRGLPTVLSQTFRTLIHSRLVVGMKAYDGKYPSDVVLFEPRRDDYRMFFTNIFSFSSRRTVCEHAYEVTRRQLLRRREELEPILEGLGLRLRVDRLEDPGRNLWRGLGMDEEGREVAHRRTLDRLSRSLDRVEDLLRRRESS
ncbi:MAG: patatin-like phospholipase family protein [Thermoanaerobaculia bacterium]|nr:patatin-like phospholipase family protein [Thermoanaerobaculia bacterium]